MDVLIATAAQRPDLVPLLRDFNPWPRFMREDPIGSLPEEGWDGVIVQAALDRFAGRRGNVVSALEISVRQDLRAQGLSGLMLAAMRDNAAALGFTSLVAPVRPSGKTMQSEVEATEHLKSLMESTPDG